MSSEKWHLVSLNDGLFIADVPPSPSGTDIPPDWGTGCGGVVLNVTDLPQAKAQAIVDAHNATLDKPQAGSAEPVVRGDVSTSLLREAREHHLACIKDAYRLLGIDGSDGEYRYKWVALEIAKLVQRTAAAVSDLTQGER